MFPASWYALAIKNFQSTPYTGWADNHSEREEIQNSIANYFRGVEKKKVAYAVYQVGLEVAQSRQHMANI